MAQHCCIVQFAIYSWNALCSLSFLQAAMEHIQGLVPQEVKSVTHFPVLLNRTCDCTVTIDQKIGDHPKHYLLWTCCYVTLFGTSSLVGKLLVTL